MLSYTNAMILFHSTLQIEIYMTVTFRFNRFILNVSAQYRSLVTMQYSK